MSNEGKPAMVDRVNVVDKLVRRAKFIPDFYCYSSFVFRSQCPCRVFALVTD